MLMNKCLEEKVDKVLIMYEKPIVILRKITNKQHLVNMLKKCFRIHKRVNHYNSRGRYTDITKGFRDEEYNETGLSLIDKNRLLAKKKMRIKKEIAGGALYDSDDDALLELAKGKHYDIDDETAMRLLEESELKQPIHLNELRLSTFENDVFVDAEPDSVNFVAFDFDDEAVQSVGF